MKHLNIDYHFVHDFVQSSVVRIVHVFAGDQFVDALTKSPPRSKLLDLCDKIGVASGTSS